MTQNQPEHVTKLALNLSTLNLAGVKSYGPSEVAILRKAGKLDEAYAKGKAQLEAEPENIWSKRDMSWVLYSLLKENASLEKINQFYTYIQDLAALNLPEDEKMIFDNVSWQVGKVIFALLKLEHPDLDRVVQLLEVCQKFSFTKPSEGYSFLFKAFHKALKDHPKYLTFADWWGLENFRDEDYQKDKLPTGKEVMSVAEQAYIAYAKQLLPRQVLISDDNVHLVDPQEQGAVLMSLGFGNNTYKTIFDKEKASVFLPLLDQLIDSHADYQYPPYFKAKLLLAMGDQENMLSAILPFAKKKRNDFWVWDVLSGAFPQEEEKRVACYCRALSCKTPDEFLINLRQKMAKWFIGQGMYQEAKMEIELAMKAREANGWKVPAEVAGWMGQAWYKEAAAKKSNEDFYQKYLPLAESILYADMPKETILVDFVNSDKKVANFITNERKTGFFKYDRFFKSLDPGDILSVRFSGHSQESHYKLLTAEMNTAEAAQLSNVLKNLQGVVKITAGKPFGFLENAFIHPSLINRYKLSDGQSVNALAAASYNVQKKEWGWKVISLREITT